tara:strand:+ start:512 stop:1432 length:921 start_codon:yes stop_codon:yes gene_type:complete
MNSSPIKIRVGGVSQLKDQALEQSESLEQQPEFNYDANLGGVSEDNSAFLFTGGFGREEKTEQNTEEKAKQLERSNMYETQTQKYNTTYDEISSRYGNYSTEEITSDLYDYDPNVSPIDILNSREDYMLLGDGGRDIGTSTLYITGDKQTKTLHQYGNIVTDKKDADNYTETINITAVNHPFYGKTFVRTMTTNKQYRTDQPITDLNNFLSNYKYIGGMGVLSEAKGNWFGIRESGEDEQGYKYKSKWEDKRPDTSDLVRAVKEGRFRDKDGNELSEGQKQEIINKYSEFYSNYKDTEKVVSTEVK